MRPSSFILGVVIWEAEVVAHPLIQRPVFGNPHVHGLSPPAGVGAEADEEK